MVTIKDSIPKASFRTFTAGAKELVVQEALEITWCFRESYNFSFTPMTTVKSALSEGALMMTREAPACRCLAASSRTISTPLDFQGNLSGFFSLKTVNVCFPSFRDPDPASTGTGARPCTESYRRR